MPLQIRSREEFEKLIEKASEIRVVKGDPEHVKVKIRLPNQLYTYVTSAEEAEELTKGLKTPIIDF